MEPAPVDGGRRAAAWRTRPWTSGLMAISIGVYAVMCLSGVSPLSPTSRQLLRWGASFGPLTLDFQPWRMLTSTYVHAGLLHLALNMWCLWNLGLLAELVFDPRTYVAVYTACGLAGSLASLWGHSSVVSIGASGAIFGLAGALIAVFRLERRPALQDAFRGTRKSLLSFAGYNLLFGALVPGIDNLAHVGGLVMGFALGTVLVKAVAEAPPERRATRRGLVFAGTALLLFAGFVLIRRARG